MLALPESWVWDFWTADDGQQYHLFFLYASKALKDPDARHYRASVGHAVSDDLVSWERVTDALVHGDVPSFDDQATWTGSVIQHPDGTWFMFYTGLTLTPAGNVQTIGAATSPDLMSWDKLPGPLLRADQRWYETQADGAFPNEAFRDPWVLPDPDGDGWHLLITARAAHGPADNRGVVGHAWSADLRRWEVRPPLSMPGSGFGQLEVLQPVRVGAADFLIFNCLADEMASGHHPGTTGGIWAAPSAGPLGPYDIAGAHLLSDDSRYVGKIVQLRCSGEQVFLAFANEGPSGFGGFILDPRPIHEAGGRLVIG